MITDNALHLRTDWETHVGPDIVTGGKVPDHYGSLTYGDMMVLYCEGRANSGWMNAIHRPILPNSGMCSLYFEMLNDSEVLANCQAQEFDFIYTKDNFKYNFSNQINQSQGGTWQISDENGLWVDTGLKPTKITSVWTSFQFSYRWYEDTKLYQTVSVKIAGVTYMVPPRLHQIKAKGTNWEDFATVQIQQDLGSKGGRMSQAHRGMNLVWL